MTNQLRVYTEFGGRRSVAVNLASVAYWYAEGQGTYLVLMGNTILHVTENWETITQDFLGNGQEAQSFIKQYGDRFSNIRKVG